MNFTQPFDLRMPLFRLDGQEVSHNGSCLIWKAALLDDFYKCLVIQQYPSVYFDEKCRKLPILVEGLNYRFAISHQCYHAHIKLSVLFHTSKGDILYQSENSIVECVAPSFVLDYEIQVFIKNDNSNNWVKFYGLTIDKSMENNS